MRVAVAGAGSVGGFIANALVENGHDVLLLENDPNVVAKMHEVPGIEVFTGDACEVSTLKEAGLDRCEVIVAATGDDEDNLVVSLLSKQEFAVPRVIARVNHPKNQWMFDATWGVDIAVSTPHLITSLVDEAVSVGRLVRLFQLEGGQVNLVEVTLADDAAVVDQAIKDLEVPRDATFVAIIRDDHVVMARGDTVMQAGDEVLALVTPESEDLVREMLTGR
jgi:trk system potassium uptake protein TrkA